MRLRDIVRMNINVVIKDPLTNFIAHINLYPRKCVHIYYIKRPENTKQVNLYKNKISNQKKFNFLDA